LQELRSSLKKFQDESKRPAVAHVPSFGVSLLYHAQPLWSFGMHTCKGAVERPRACKHEIWW
jgi:hypothetical protein